PRRGLSARPRALVPRVRSPALLLLVVLLPRRPPRCPLFPYTTLFRSVPGRFVPPPARSRAPLGRAAPVPRPRRRATVRRGGPGRDRKSTRLNSSHVKISYAGFCLKKKRTAKRAYSARHPVRARETAPP